ncbi:MAG: DUF4126 domain-containing protein [bacterium]|nr:DUF4126 domain-containing protein [bacterium]
MEMESTLVSIAIGLGLAAACGFRIFVPLLLISIAARSGHLGLAESFEWMGSTPALIAFGSATALEIGAYYIPFLDNLLDTIATPSAVVAGIIASASQVTHMDPLLGWSVAIVAGGAAAGVVQGMTTVTRGLSSMATGGFGNPLFSTVEAGASVAMTVLAILVPMAAAFVLLILMYVAVKRLFFRAPAGNAA